jgi:hypothetical protein
MRFLRGICVGFVATLCCVGMSNAQGKKSATAPTPAATPATQSAPSSSASFESQMRAFGGLDLVAANIAVRVCGQLNPNSTVIIYDQTAFASLQAYEAFIANVRILYGSYKDLIPPIANPTEDEKTYGLGTSNAIDPFADATSLLSAIAIATNTETPGSITIPDSSMALALTKRLRSACAAKAATVAYPPLFGIGSSTDSSSADLQSEIKKLDYVRNRAQNEVRTATATFITQHQNAPAGDPVLNAVLGDLDGLYDSFMNGLLQINGSTGTAGSAAVIQGFQLANFMRGPKVTTVGSNGVANDTYPKPAYLLLASITNAGGTTHDHKNIWTALWSGDKITYSGGLVVNFALWNTASNQPILTNVLRYRAPFDKISEPSSVENVSAGDNLQQ